MATEEEFTEFGDKGKSIFHGVPSKFVKEHMQRFGRYQHPALEENPNYDPYMNNYLCVSFSPEEALAYSFRDPQEDGSLLIVPVTQEIIKRYDMRGVREIGGYEMPYLKKGEFIEHFTQKLPEDIVECFHNDFLTDLPDWEKRIYRLDAICKAESEKVRNIVDRIIPEHIPERDSTLMQMTLNGSLRGINDFVRTHFYMNSSL